MAEAAPLLSGTLRCSAKQTSYCLLPSGTCAVTWNSRKGQLAHTRGFYLSSPHVAVVLFRSSLLCVIGLVPKDGATERKWDPLEVGPSKKPLLVGAMSLKEMVGFWFFSLLFLVDEVKGLFDFSMLPYCGSKITC